MSALVRISKPQSRQAGTPAATVIRRSHRPLCRATARTNAGFVSTNNGACLWARAGVGGFVDSDYVGPSLATCLARNPANVTVARTAPAMTNRGFGPRPPQAAALHRKNCSHRSPCLWDRATLSGNSTLILSLTPVARNSLAPDYNIASFFVPLNYPFSFQKTSCS